MNATDTDIIIAAAELDFGIKPANRFTDDTLMEASGSQRRNLVKAGVIAEPQMSVWKQCLPQYLTSTDAALRLVEKLRADGWMMSASNGLDGTWEVEMYRQATAETKQDDIAILHGFRGPMELHYIPEATLPRAITLACLRAAGRLP